MQNIPFHPLADIFPLIHGKEFVELKEDIKANGVHEPVVLFEGKILDGRNRFRACQEVGVEPPLEEYTGSDPLGYVISLNLHRRHLNESQRAMVAAKIANLSVGKPNSANLQNNNTRAQAAEMLNVSERSVNTAKSIFRDGDESLQQAVTDGRVSLNAASDIAKIPKEEQKEIVAKGEKEILQKAKEIRAEKAKERKSERIAEVERQKEEISRETPQAPFGLFHVISIDPPWPYDTDEEGIRSHAYDPSGNRASNPYPEMPLKDIAALNIPAADNCVLWLWTTHKFMRHSFELLDAWGFQDKVILTWVKSRMGLGRWLRSQSEFCIMATKGSPVINLTNQTTVLHGELREHSRKPDEFYEMVENLCPGRRLDFFSRESREGWEQFGNDVKKFA